MDANQKDGGRNEVLELDRLLSENESLKRARDTIVAAMEAVRTYWDGVSKKMVSEPDYKTRLAAAEMLLAYKIGKPIERKEILQKNVGGLDELMAQAKASPALRRSLANLLRDLEGEIVESRPTEGTS